MRKKCFIPTLLQSELNGRYYVGYSEFPDRRLLEHNSGKIKSTRSYRPWKKVYEEAFKSEIEAIRRERAIKSMKSKIFIQQLVDTSRSNRDDG